MAPSPLVVKYSRGLWRLIVSLLPDDDEHLPKFAKELRHQCYRFEDRMGDLRERSEKLQVIVQQLEAKMQVITSILSHDQPTKISNDVLEDG